MICVAFFILITCVTLSHGTTGNNTPYKTFGVFCDSCNGNGMKIHQGNILDPRIPTAVFVCNNHKKYCEKKKQELLEIANTSLDFVLVPSPCITLPIENKQDVFDTVYPIPGPYVKAIQKGLCMSKAQTDNDTNIWLLPGKVGVLSMAVIQDLNWRNVIIVHDNSTRVIAQFIIDNLSREGISHIRYNCDEIKDDGFIKTVEVIYENLFRKGINVTMICKYQCVSKLMTQVNKFDILKKNKGKTALNQYSRWLLITNACDVKRLASIITNLDNVLLLNLRHTNKSLQINHQVKLNLLNMVWQVFNIFSNRTEIEDNDLINDLITNITSAEASLGIGKYSIKTLMWYKTGRYFSGIGYVTSSGDLQVGDNYFPNEQYGFNGRRLLVTTNQEYVVFGLPSTREAKSFPPFVIRTKHGNTTSYYGFCIDILIELAKHLNFTYDLTEPDDGEWGREGDNGTWTGMIGQLQARVVDLMAAPASIHAGREMVMDFSYPYYFDSSTFMMRRPDPNKNKWLTLISPLSWQVMVSIAAFLPVCAVLLFFIERQNARDLEFADNRPSYLYLFWYMFGALLQEGGHIPNLTRKGKIFVSFWWIFTMILAATYSGNLVAFLTVTKPYPPFTTFDELASQTQYKWGVLGGTIFLTTFKKSPLQTFQILWEGIRRENASNKDFLNQNPEVHIARILAEDYVYIDSKSYMEVRTSDDCRFLIAEDEIPNMSYGIGLPNNSPFTELFSKKVLELQESGLLQVIKRRNWPKRNLCEDSSRTKFKAISIIDLQSAFYVLGVGMFVAFLLLTFECFLQRIKFCTECCNTKCL